MRVQLKLLMIALAAGLTLAPGATPAVDTTPEPAASPELVSGRRAIESRDWEAAIKSLTAAAQREPRNADVQNLLGYAYRNSGQLDAALKHYQRALQIDPRHLGAHEYIGEAYLMANEPAKAEEHLAALKRYCLPMCSERDDLSAKIASYKARAK